MCEYNPIMKNSLEMKIDFLRNILRQEKNFTKIASQCGLIFDKTNITDLYSLKFFNSKVIFSFPDLLFSFYGSNIQLPIIQQGIILYYLTTSDGTIPTGKWVSFGDLSGGKFYNKAFQGYTGKILENRFEEFEVKFYQIIDKFQGKMLTFGDFSFEISALPNIPIAFVYWKGDSEFKSSCQILFDETATRHIPIDVCAMAGSTFTKSILHELGS